MASKQPRRSNLKSDLKFLTQTSYTTMFVLTVLTFFDHFDRKKEEEEQLRLLDLSASPQVKILALGPRREKCRIGTLIILQFYIE